MKLAKDIPIETLDYASQGNGILGIRDSGKSYSATFIAERLMTAGIPIIAFDPIGVWKYLKVGDGKHPGFPVVVAGDGGDLPLTADNAVDIVRAAMKENVSLVIDLYSMSLSKNDWKKIVEKCVRLLLYENKQYGMRHIFIEEAAEFCPQRVRPDEGRVYAEIEKLARMGGNASLGYTLINQRAEEVNKAVLELCDCLLLHRQKGRHSLTALGKWLDVADASNSNEVIKSLPSLSQGECWVWMQGSHTPTKVKMPKKLTMHPDRKNPEGNKTIREKADVSEFIERMQALLPATEEHAGESTIGSKKSPKAKHLSQTLKPEPKQNFEQMQQKDDEIISLKSQLEKEKDYSRQVVRKLETVKVLLMPEYEKLKSVFENFSEADESSTTTSDYQIWLDKFGNGKKKHMLEVLIKRGRVTRQQLGVLVGMSHTSGSFSTYLGELKSVGLIKKEGDDFVLQKV